MKSRLRWSRRREEEEDRVEQVEGLFKRYSKQRYE
jgi:hypothetical protein